MERPRGPPVISLLELGGSPPSLTIASAVNLGGGPRSRFASPGGGPVPPGAPEGGKYPGLYLPPYQRVNCLCMPCPYGYHVAVCSLNALYGVVSTWLILQRCDNFTRLCATPLPPLSIIDHSQHWESQVMAAFPLSRMQSLSTVSVSQSSPLV